MTPLEPPLVTAADSNLYSVKRSSARVPHRPERNYLLTLEQAHVLLATAKAANVDVVLVEQLQVEVAKGSLFLKDSMGLMPISAPGHDDGQVVTGMTRGIAKVTPHDHGGVVEQEFRLLPGFDPFQKGTG